MGRRQSGDERDVVLLEHVHEAGEVQQGPAEAIHLIDHDAVNAAGVDVGQQPAQGWPVGVATGEAAVVVALGQAGPAGVDLAVNVRLGRLALGIE